MLLLAGYWEQKIVGFDDAGKFVSSPVKTRWANQGGTFACL